MSLKSFNARFNITADRLGDFGMPLPSTVKLVQMMRAIQYQYPQVYELFGRDFDKGYLTWESFQGEVIRVADEEENDHVEAFLLVAPHKPSRRGEGPRQLALSITAVAGMDAVSSTPNDDQMAQPSLLTRPGAHIYVPKGPLVYGGGLGRTRDIGVCIHWTSASFRDSFTSCELAGSVPAPGTYPRRSPPAA
ncbi:hypothetical protein Hte_011310 [Hypoxylon texense]